MYYTRKKFPTKKKKKEKKRKEKKRKRKKFHIQFTESIIFI